MVILLSITLLILSLLIINIYGDYTAGIIGGLTYYGSSTRALKKLINSCSMYYNADASRTGGLSCFVDASTYVALFAASIAVASTGSTLIAQLGRGPSEKEVK